MMSGLERNCASCIWWERCGPKLANAIRDPSSTYELGTCQVRSPVVIQGNAPFPVSMFPQTHESRFCGDWAGCDLGGDGDGGERVIQFPAQANRIAA